MPSTKQRAKSTVVAQRRDAAIRDLINGVPRAEIIAKYGYSSSAALTMDVKRAYADARATEALTVDEHRQMALDRLDALYLAAWRVLSMFHVRISNGEVVRIHDAETGDTQLLEDTAPCLAAIDRLLRIEAQRMELQGTKAPAQLEVAGTMRVVVDSVDLGELT